MKPAGSARLEYVSQAAAMCRRDASTAADRGCQHRNLSLVYAALTFACWAGAAGRPGRWPLLTASCAYTALAFLQRDRQARHRGIAAALTSLAGRYEALAEAARGAVAGRRDFSLVDFSRGLLAAEAERGALAGSLSR